MSCRGSGPPLVAGAARQRLASRCNPRPPGPAPVFARFQVYDRQYFKHAGIDPAAKSVVAVKSAHHFRADFGPIARAIVVVDSGAHHVTTPQLAIDCQIEERAAVASSVAPAI